MSGVSKEEKDFIEWAYSKNIKRMKYDDMTIEFEFWSPPQKEESKIDLTSIMSAPITEDEIFGYDPPEHLKDPDDIEINKK